MAWRRGCKLALGLALAASAARADVVPVPPPPPMPYVMPLPARGFATHMLGEGTALELHLGERAVFTLADAGKMKLVQVMRGDAPGVELAAGQVAMTLAPAPQPGQPGAVRLFVRTALDGPLRYHAAITRRQPDGTMAGKSTTVCPVLPKVLDVEQWADHVDTLLVLMPRLAEAGDTACKD